MKLTIEETRRLKNLREGLLGTLYPRVCPGCGKILGRVKIEKDSSGGGNNPFICTDCYKKLDFAQGQPRCIKCSRPIDDEREAFCPVCSQGEREFTQGCALMVHNETARKAVYDLKYSSMKDNADFLGCEAAAKLGSYIEGVHAQAVIPVPLYKEREFERGYNQALLFAKNLKFFMEIKGLKCPPIDTEYLVRARNTRRLKDITGRERMKNINGAFKVTGEAGRYRSVILIDDIFTTGATLNECSKILHMAGVTMIYFITATIGS